MALRRTCHYGAHLRHKRTPVMRLLSTPCRPAVAEATHVGLDPPTAAAACKAACKAGRSVAANCGSREGGCRSDHRALEQLFYRCGWLRLRRVLVRFGADGVRANTGAEFRQEKPRAFVRPRPDFARYEPRPDARRALRQREAAEGEVCSTYACRRRSRPTHQATARVID